MHKNPLGLAKAGGGHRDLVLWCTQAGLYRDTLRYQKNKNPFSILPQAEDYRTLDQCKLA